MRCTGDARALRGAKPTVENSVINAAQRRSLEEAIVDTVREPLIVLDENLRVVVASRSFYRAFATAREDTDGQFLYELGNGQWNIPSLRRLLEEIIPHHTTIEEFEVQHDFRRWAGARCC